MVVVRDGLDESAVAVLTAVNGLRAAAADIDSRDNQAKIAISVLRCRRLFIGGFQRQGELLQMICVGAWLDK